MHVGCHLAGAQLPCDLMPWHTRWSHVPAAQPAGMAAHSLPQRLQVDRQKPNRKMKSASAGSGGSIMRAAAGCARWQAQRRAGAVQLL